MMHRAHRQFHIGVIGMLLLALSVVSFAAFQMTDTVSAADEDSLHGSDFYDLYMPEDLELLKSFPSSEFRLKNDIDMSGVEYVPGCFSGTLDGEGHAILNLSVSSAGSGTAVICDGNNKPYSCALSGLFTELRNAEIRNLSLLGLELQVEQEGDCFVGGFAGYMSDSKITDCSVSGKLSLSAAANCFGIGGFAGAGEASAITNSYADVLLVCTDLDAENQDEQFMGGAYGCGCVNLDGCGILLRGYDSDHGYVHNGGIAGLYNLPTDRWISDRYVTNCSVKGYITFFEDNRDRRAYCDGIFGESLFGCKKDNTDAELLRDERFTYDEALLPCRCGGRELCPEELPADDCTGFACTRYFCGACGEYLFSSGYRIPAHDYDEILVLTEPTLEQEGFRKCHCASCGDWVYETVPVLQPEPDIPEYAGQPDTTEAEPAELKEPDTVSDTFPEAAENHPAEASEEPAPSEPEHNGRDPQETSEPHAEQEPAETDGSRSAVLPIAICAACLLAAVFAVLRKKRYRGKHSAS